MYRRLARPACMSAPAHMPVNRPYSSGYGEKYQASISNWPIWIWWMCLTLVTCNHVNAVCAVAGMCLFVLALKLGRGRIHLGQRPRHVVHLVVLPLHVPRHLQLHELFITLVLDVCHTLRCTAAGSGLASAVPSMAALNAAKSIRSSATHSSSRRSSARMGGDQYYSLNPTVGIVDVVLGDGVLLVPD